MYSTWAIKVHIPGAEEDGEPEVDEYDSEDDEGVDY